MSRLRTSSIKGEDARLQIGRITLYNLPSSFLIDTEPGSFTEKLVELLDARQVLTPMLAALCRLQFLQVPDATRHVPPMESVGPIVRGRFAELVGWLGCRISILVKEIVHLLFGT
jgi:hypothetical protein